MSQEVATTVLVFALSGICRRRQNVQYDCPVLAGTNGRKGSFAAGRQFAATTANHSTRKRTFLENFIVFSCSYCRFAPMECRSARINAGSFAVIPGLTARIDAVIPGSKSRQMLVEAVLNAGRYTYRSFRFAIRD